MALQWNPDRKKICVGLKKGFCLPKIHFVLSHWTEKIEWQTNAVLRELENLWRPFWEPMELKCSPCECVLPLSNLNSCGPAVVQVEPRPALVIVWIRSCFPLVNLRMMKWWKINERMFAFLNSLPPHKIPGKRSGSTESRSDVSGTHAWETLTKHWAETSVLKCESHQSKLKKKKKQLCEWKLYH